MQIGINDNVLTIVNDENNIIIKNINEDKDIIFKVNDGGVDTEVMRIQGSTGFVQIGNGNGNPSLQLEVIGDILANQGVLQYKKDGISATARGSVWSDTILHSPIFRFIRGKGTEASPTAITDGTIIGSFQYLGYYDTENSSRQGELYFIASENWDGSNKGVELKFIGTNNGSTTRTDWLTMEDGKLFLPQLGTLTGKSDVQYDSGTGELGYVSSSERYKENITDIVDTDFLKDLTVKEFNYIGETEKKIGLIAEDVAQVYPQCVGYALFKVSDLSRLDRKYKNFKDYLNIEPEVITSATLYYDKENENGEVTEMIDTFDIIKKPDTVSYSSLVPILLKEIQKLETRIEVLESNIL